MPEAGTEIRREVRIGARPEVVYSFFTDSDKMTRWKGVKAELEPQPGGIYRVDINGRDVASGRFLELEPYRRIVFTWGWEAPGHPVPPGSSTVEVSFQAAGGGTLVTLVHRDLPAGAEMAHEEGWDLFLPRLVAAAAGSTD